MKNLIEALQILLKYENIDWSTYCEHDELGILGIRRGNKSDVFQEDIEKLNKLGFSGILQARVSDLLSLTAPRK